VRWRVPANWTSEPLWLCRFSPCEEETWAAWLYDLLKPHVTEVVVCNPRKAALPKDGSKGGRIDARNCCI